MQKKPRVVLSALAKILASVSAIALAQSGYAVERLLPALKYTECLDHLASPKPAIKRAHLSVNFANLEKQGGIYLIDDGRIHRYPIDLDPDGPSSSAIDKIGGNGNYSDLELNGSRRFKLRRQRLGKIEVLRTGKKREYDVDPSAAAHMAGDVLTPVLVRDVWEVAPARAAIERDILRAIGERYADLLSFRGVAPSSPAYAAIAKKVGEGFDKNGKHRLEKSACAKVLDLTEVMVEGKNPAEEIQEARRKLKIKDGGSADAAIGARPASKGHAAE